MQYSDKVMDHFPAPQKMSADWIKTIPTSETGTRGAPRLRRRF